MTTIKSGKSRKIDMKVVKKRVIFWTVFAIVVAYALLFLLTFAKDAHADAQSDCAAKGSDWAWDNSQKVCYQIGNHGCGVDTYFSWGCNKTSTNNSEQVTPLLITILNWLAVGVTLAVVAGIIYGAVLYTTSGGNQEQARKSIGIIRNAVIALILYFAMWALLNWLVPGGLFSN